MLPQRGTRLLRLGLHELPVQLLCSRPLGLSCIAVIANIMSSSDSEDVNPSTVNDQILREAVYRGDLDAARRCLDEGASTAGVFTFLVRDNDNEDDDDDIYDIVEDVDDADDGADIDDDVDDAGDGVVDDVGCVDEGDDVFDVVDADDVLVVVDFIDDDDDNDDDEVDDVFPMMMLATMMY